MKVFVDEDTGSGVGKALQAVDVDSWYVGRKCRITPGTDDEVWIPIIADGNRLVLSRNSQMLDSDKQRQLLIDHQAAIVFLPAHLTKLSLLKLVLRKWTWLEWVYDNEPRACAFRVTPGGTHVPEDLLKYVPRRRRTNQPGGTALDPPPPSARKTRVEQLGLLPVDE